MSIGIVGLGYVGLPLAVAFAEAGEDVIGVDVDPGKVNGLREGRSHIEDIPSERLQAVAGPQRASPPARSTCTGRRRSSSASRRRSTATASPTSARCSAPRGRSPA